MRFEISHVTEYRYGQPAAEAYVEARLTPQSTESQKILSHAVVIDPDVRVSNYVDYYGNVVSFFSLPYRHQKLFITNQLEVETLPIVLPAVGLETPVQEARQIFGSALADYYDFVQPTEMVSIGREASLWAKKYLRSNFSLKDGLWGLNKAIYTDFAYQPGETDNSTQLETVWKSKRGVCQDFVHVMMSVLRTAGLPCRYVCGYIETDPPAGGEEGKENLVGSVATHAWTEVLVPGMHWVALDPTNNQWCGERHVAVSYGCDAHDATPLRGTFKGSGASRMRISVEMRRKAA